MLKKGDKLLCKKMKGNLFIKNKYYTISNTYTIMDGSQIFNITSEKDGNFSFHLMKDGDWYLYDIFISLKEERKLKLEKINENR